MTIDLIGGEDGVFDIAVDGRVVFSKHESGGFIETDRAVELIRELIPE